MKKSIYRSLVLLFFVAELSHAQELPTPTSASLEFLRFGFGGRPAALGDAYIGFSNDIYGVLYNPAGLAELTSGQISTTFHKLFLDINHFGLGLAIPSGFGSFGVGLNGVIISNIEARDSVGNLTGDYGAQFLNPIVTYGRSFGPFGLGVNLKTVLGFIEDTRTATILLDLGTKLTFPHIGFGLVLENFGPEVRYLTEGYNPPMAIKAGAGVSFSRFNCALDLLKPFDAGFAFRTGVEYSVINNLTLRLGYRTDLAATGSLGGFCFGFGVNAAKLYVDYAFLPYGDLGLTHCFSLSYRFGMKEKKTEERIAEELKTKEQLMSSTLLNQGINFYNQERYQEALNTWDLALIWNPDNAEAQSWIDRTKAEEEKRTIGDLVAQGKKYLELKDYPNAIECFDQLLALDPANQEAGKLKDQAKAEYARLLLGTDPKIKEYLENGLQEFSRGNYAAAIEAWRKVVALSSTNKEALDNIKRAELKIAEEVAAGLTRVERYDRNEQWMKAIQECNRLLKIAPDNQQLLDKKFSLQKKVQELINSSLRSGEEKFKAGSFHEAERYFRTALSYDPQNLTARRYLDDIEKQKSKAKEDPYQLYLLGVEAYTKDDYELAISYWERVLKIDPGNSRARKNIERARQKLAAGG